MTAPVNVPEHTHDWERGAHMRDAFGVDGRRYYCAICAVPYWCHASIDRATLCENHGGEWPFGEMYCTAHGPTVRWTV